MEKNYYFCTRMVNLELLSPAKNLECGISAISHGADAVYIGAAKYGARASAGNSLEDIEALCSYAHQYDAKVYVTINTIIYDEELDDTISLIRQLCSIGVDALLLQDMGLLTHIRKAGIDIPLHASTQTDNRSAEKAQWLSSQGFSRVVLARELSIKEIAAIHEAAPDTELEVFVHGALCVSYSGQCYASQYCFNRSANRGECAQFCRMPFTLQDATGKVFKSNAYMLSLKDMAQLSNLEKLALAGATSFKIEGRLKDADYVKNVTAAYSTQLNAICKRHPNLFQRASQGHCTYSFTPDIQKSFNRGFTTYFAEGRQADMASLQTPKSIGEPVGHVKELQGKSFTVSSTKAFSNGDGLCFYDADGRLIGFRVNRVENNRLFPHAMPCELRAGTPLFRNYDKAFQDLLDKPSSQRKIDISITLIAREKELILKVVDERGNEFSHSLPYDYQEAQKPQEENIRQQLSKLGGTIYVCNDIRIENEVKNPFIPSSILTTLRRVTMELFAQQKRSKNPQGTDGNESAKYKDTRAPQYKLGYLYNAANEEAREYYRSQGVSDACAFETEGTDRKGAADKNADRPLLMQCRYCIKNELGFCSKKVRNAPFKEPLCLRLDDGRTFELHFNCKKCEMYLSTFNIQLSTK